MFSVGYKTNIFACTKHCVYSLFFYRISSRAHNPVTSLAWVRSPGMLWKFGAEEMSLVLFPSRKNS